LNKRIDIVKATSQKRFTLELNYKHVHNRTQQYSTAQPDPINLLSYSFHCTRKAETNYPQTEQPHYDLI